jgi:aminoglycoside phosphotransferase (APT) family kinase protein
VRVLDWELALWGDALLDAARHLNRTPYPAVQRAEFLRRWAEVMPAEHITGWETDLAFYEMAEHLQLALLNLPRYAEAFRAAPTPAEADTVVDTVLAELRAAHPHWTDSQAPTRNDVLAALRRSRHR